MRTLTQSSPLPSPRCAPHKRTNEKKKTSHGYFRDVFAKIDTGIIPPSRSFFGDDEHGDNDPDGPRPRPPPSRRLYVLKSLRLHEDHHVGITSIEDTRKDAVIMDALSESSRIVAGYGLCGTSVLTEFVDDPVEPTVVREEGRAKQEDLDEKVEFGPENDMGAEEKLRTALEMAEALAVLHGYGGGVIVHGEFSPGMGWDGMGTPPPI